MKHNLSQMIGIKFDIRAGNPSYVPDPTVSSLDSSFNLVYKDRYLTGTTKIDLLVSAYDGPDSY